MFILDQHPGGRDYGPEFLVAVVPGLGLVVGDGGDIAGFDTLSLMTSY